MLVEGFNANDVRPSSYVGLHPQLLYFDVSRFDGANVGRKANQLVTPGQFTTYEWYAGDVTINPDGTVTATPIEFGATNLRSSDRIEHASKGAIGALIIEPPSAIISEFDPYRRAVDTISGGTEGSFREVVQLLQNDVNMRTDSSLVSSASLEIPDRAGNRQRPLGHPARAVGRIVRMLMRVPRRRARSLASRMTPSPAPTPQKRRGPRRWRSPGAW